MSSLFERAIEKNVDVAFDFLSQTERTRSFHIVSNNPFLDGGHAESYLEDGAFHLAFSTTRVLSQVERESFWGSDFEFTCKSSERNLVFGANSFASRSIDFMTDARCFKCKVRQYRSDGLSSSDGTFFRMVLPTKRELHPGGMIASSPFRCRQIVHACGLVSVELGSQRLELLPLTEKDAQKHFLIVDAANPIDYFQFLKLADVVLHAYAFLTGYFPRDSRHVFSSRDASFTDIVGVGYDTLPPSLVSAYSAVPSSALRIHLGLPQKPSVSQPFFSHFCNKLSQHQRLLRVLLLVVEAHPLSIELRATLYAIALEAMTDIVYGENKSKLHNVEDRSLATEVVDALIVTLKTFHTKLSEEAIRILTRKIAAVNEPTNRQKLLRPFELLGIRLKKSEIDCIDQRNHFLHGRMPLNSSDSKEVYAVEQTALTLQYCITALILKYVGYNGEIVYYPTLNQFKHEVKLTDYVIKVI